MSNTDERLAIARRILTWEARRDAKGRLTVYVLPAGDGGGKYEVAGINDRYHPKKAAELRALIEAGKFDDAERSAVEYIATQTDGADRWTTVTAIECYLRDCYFNRGAGGAARIYQMALNVDVDGDVGKDTMTAARTAELTPNQLLQDLRAARERYEREVVKRDEKSKFWKGLVNRWNNALAYSLTFLK